ncbi:MAG TPA: type II toxin-antitoxin system RelE/ParE family toxin [Rhizobacter sp.]|nr:type II toxin-antitoxin system RelE/ParE family toxin [Rhizobacter sp.]
MNHCFSPAARRELLEAGQRHLTDGGQVIAEQFEGEGAIQRALQLLEFMPQLGKPSYPGVRTWALYRVAGEVITVVAVAHPSREPGYWAGR